MPGHDSFNSGVASTRTRPRDGRAGCIAELRDVYPFVDDEQRGHQEL